MAKLKSINPTNGEILGSVKISTKADVEETVKKAKKGFIEWRQVELSKRKRILLRLANLLEKNSKKLGEMITLEMGKPLKEAVDEVESCAETVRFIAKEGARVLQDEVVEPKLSEAQIKKMRKLEIRDGIKYLSKKGKKVISVVRFDPVGVVAAIKPWNYPLDTPMLSIASALIAGNVVVFKPSEEVPLVSNELAKLIWQAGVPKDVLLVLFGRGSVGSMLVDSKVDMVSFTGSSQVGKEIAEKCAKRFVKYVLELGGSSPAIVLKDADLELAARAIVWGRFANCGQICSAIKRVFVEEEVAEKLIELFVEKTNELRVGDPSQQETDVGPLVSSKQLKKLQDQVTRGVIQGGRIVAGGRRMREEPFIQGFFHEPTVMHNVIAKHEIMQEEVFGPVLTVSMVENFKQAIKGANNSAYGLTAAIFTKSKLKARKAQRKLEAGGVFVNDSMVFYPETPWGGLKESGVGVESGKYGILEYVNKKHMHVNFSTDEARDGRFPY